MIDAQQAKIDRRMLDRAAWAAFRAAGDVEPNPLVGAVLGHIEGDRVCVIGVGHHRVFGGPHAEIEALMDCRKRGIDPAGATMWVTLEPCAHYGKTPPCVEALVKAQIGQVVIAQRDPGELSGGGAERLQIAGIPARFTNVSGAAIRLSEPFVKRVQTGLPWVIAKWAQTIDGRLATRTGDSKWISNERSRLDVHRLRSRVDAIVTGIGTAIADNPSLTARGVRRVRRIAKRVVIDTNLDLSTDSVLVRSVKEAPVIVFCSDRAAQQKQDQAKNLESAGVVLAPMPEMNGKLDLRACLKSLLKDHDVATVLVEAGAGLLSSLMNDRLIDELRVYVAPMLMGDESALPVMRGGEVGMISQLDRFHLDRIRRFGNDALLRYRLNPLIS